MSEVDVHVSHVYQTVLVDDGKTFVCSAGTGQCIQLFDNRHQLWHNGIQIGTRPFFQCFCQNGMVGVSTGSADNFNSFFKRNALFTKQADEFRNDHTRVCIIDLDGSIIGKIMIIAATGSTFSKDQLCTGRNHQVLLIYTQAAAGFIRIIRVEKQCQVFVDGSFVKGDTIMNDAFVDGVEVKQVQGVGAAFVAGNCQFVQSGSVFFACQFYRIGYIGFFCPAVCSQPWIWFFVLDIIFKGLMEKSEVISQTNAVTWQVQCCQRVQKAGSQTSQTAVAKRRFRFYFLNV